jgi:hypothetical protein
MEVMMRVTIISIFLLNLLTSFYVGLVLQDKLAQYNVKKEQEKVALLQQQKQEEEKIIDFTRFPNLRIGGFTKAQTKLLATAYELGMEYTYETREVIQAILLQESAAGTVSKIGGLHLPVGLRYYGVMQMKVKAVQDVLSSHSQACQHFFQKPLVKVSDEEIIAKLLTDDKFSIRMAYAYYDKYRQRSKDVYQAITMYNQGPGGAMMVDNFAEFDYTANVVRHIRYNVRPFNKQLEKRFEIDPA